MGFKTILFACIVSLGAMAANASTVVVGNDAIDRGDFDSRTAFAIAMGSDVFSDGVITSWSAFIGSENQSRTGGLGNGTFGLLVLEAEAAANTWRVVASDIRTVGNIGLHTFTTSIAVSAGQVLGAYMNTAKISMLNRNGVGIDPTVDQSRGIGAIVDGSTIFTGDPSNLQRLYSINATVAPVPLPAAAWLLLAGIGALAAAGRKSSPKA